MMEHKPKLDPPQWLKDGDENWGPTDLRKRKARPLPAPPPLPAIWSTQVDQPTENRWANILRIIAVLLGFLRGEDEAPLFRFLRGFATWFVIIVLCALVFEWLRG